MKKPWEGCILKLEFKSRIECDRVQTVDTVNVTTNLVSFVASFFFSSFDQWARAVEKSHQIHLRSLVPISISMNLSNCQAITTTRNSNENGRTQFEQSLSLILKWFRFDSLRFVFTCTRICRCQIQSISLIIAVAYRNVRVCAFALYQDVNRNKEKKK